MTPLQISAQAPPLRQDGSPLRVGTSNVTLETVLWAYRNGATSEGIADQFPTLDRADVYAVVAYYLHHQAEVDAYLAEQERCAEEVAIEVQRLFPSTITRAELERWPLK